MRWYLRAVLLFWGSTAAVLFADFAGERWLGIEWPQGPDLFPNMVLGIALALGQIAAGCLLVIAVAKTAARCETYIGVGLVILLGAFFGLANYFVFALVALWYLIAVMGRTL